METEPLSWIIYHERGRHGSKDGTRGDRILRIVIIVGSTWDLESRYVASGVVTCLNNINIIVNIIE